MTAYLGWKLIVERDDILGQSRDDPSDRGLVVPSDSRSHDAQEGAVEEVVRGLRGGQEQSKGAAENEERVGETEGSVN